MAKRKSVVKEDTHVKTQKELKEKFNFFKKIKTGNVGADKEKQAEPTELFDTKCYALNAILSGDIYKGFPNNKILMLAGEQQVGKTYFAVHGFCKPLVDKGYFIYYIDTEGAVDYDDLENFGIPREQCKILREEVAEQLRFSLTAILNKIEESMDGGVVNENKCAFVLDSQGQLDTEKSRKDAAERKDKVDLTLQKELKKTYKNVTGRMNKMNIPFLITNHVYDDNMSFIKKTVVSGGQGGLYASSVILHLRKKQYKEGDVRKGTIVTAKIYKSRWCREGLEAALYLNFNSGLHKYYGLHLFADKAGLIEKWKKPTKKEIEEDTYIKYKNAPEKPGNSNWYMIKDPKVDKLECIICKEKDIFKEEVIGTILDEINEWTNKNIKLLRPIDFQYDEPEDTFNVEEDLAEEASV